MNNAGIRDTARVLTISINAVVRTLKNSRRKTQPRFRWIVVEFKLSVKSMKCGHLSAIKSSNVGCGMHGSLVLSASLHMWLRRRSKTVLCNLLSLSSGSNITFWCMYNFSAYDILPSEKHIIGKFYTQRIDIECEYYV